MRLFICHKNKNGGRGLVMLINRNINPENKRFPVDFHRISLKLFAKIRGICGKYNVDF